MKFRLVAFLALLPLAGCKDDPVNNNKVDNTSPFLAALEALACDEGQVAKYVSGNWSCADDIDTINTQLREVLDDATDKWGVRVVRVEIQRIDPPPDIVSAMHAQMRAERDRRATVTEAKGYQEAAIARADGEQQAAVLSAQGRKEAAVLDAQGDAEAIQLRAGANKLRLTLLGEGEGAAAKARLTGIKEAETNQNVLTVEYLKALERIGDGRATKLVIPAEFSGLLGTFAAITESMRPDDADDELRPKDGLPVPTDDERVELPEPNRDDHRDR
jgi:hypothetical protein